MPRVALVHWNASETAARVARLRAAGYEATAAPTDGRAAYEAIRREGPQAVVIDLDRLPSHGRDLAAYLRQSKATRHLPIVFAGGEPDKVAAIRRLLPDAAFASWRGIRRALDAALAGPLEEPVVPASVMAGYSGTPLPKKLGIKPGNAVALIAPPEGFEATLGDLPAGASLRSSARGRLDLTIWFVRERRELAHKMAAMARRAAAAPLWIAWPKKTSALASDFGESEVRSFGLAAGLVDYKICAIDGTWSGLLFRQRR